LPTPATERGNGHQCAYDSTRTGSCNPPFLFHRELKKSQVEKYTDSRKKLVYTTKLSGLKCLRIQSSHFRFRIQNLQRHDRTEEFLFQICVNNKINPVVKNFPDSARIRNNFLKCKPSLTTWGIRKRNVASPLDIFRRHLCSSFKLKLFSIIDLEK